MNSARHELNDAQSATLDRDELQRRLDSLQTLLEVACDLAVEIDLDRVLGSITDCACRALECERASFFQFDAEAGQLFTRVVTSLEIEEIRVDLGQGIVGHVAESRTMTSIDDPSADDRWNPTFDQKTGYHTRNILTGPVLSLSDGELFGVLQLLNKHRGPFTDRDELLLQAFAQHAAAAIDRARLIEARRQQQEIESSLSAARAVQQAFMPSTLPQVPGYEAAFWYMPNEAVGGDYCDFVPLADGRLGLVVADVSGHGLGPSLLMATVRSALRTLAVDHSCPKAIIDRLSRTLANDFGGGRFVTMVIAALDTAKHRLEFANAGHAPALHYRYAHDSFLQFPPGGVPLGILPEAEYPLGEAILLEPGDLVLLCTDGLIEAMNEQDELFGEARLENEIRAARDLPLAELTGLLGHQVQQFAATRPDDDLTVLALRRST